MTDKNKFLPAGTELIEANGTCYKIRRVIARGGSAVVYEAEQEGSFRVFALKECYPNSTEFSFTRRKGVVCPTDSTNLDAKNYLRLIKRNIERENKIGQLIANKTGRTVAPWGKLNVKEIILDRQSCDAADSLFIVMERINDDEKLRGIFLGELLDECAKEPNPDAPLRNGGCPSPYIAASILTQLLKSLRDIHAAGYLHGDINDANFFLMGHNFKGGDIGVGQLLDFGNAQELLADGKTAPIKNFFSTPGYYPPEIFFREEKPLRLTPATDIYSVGCLMIYLFYGMSYKKAHREGIVASGRIPSVSIPEAIRHGYRHDSAALFKKILYKALQFKPEDRYNNGSEMLDDIIQLKKLTAPPKFLLAQNLSRSPYFVDGSRDIELTKLQHALAKDIHPIWIFAIGGEGKTELAMEFARKEIARGRTAFLVRFNDSMKDTVLNMNFSGWRFEFDGQGDIREKEYQAKLDLLKENYENALMIIDNFDSETKTLAELQNEPAYKDLLSLNMKILFTTRSHPDGGIELTPLSDENCLKLFRAIAKFPVDEEPIVRKIIREVDGHVMSIELLARTLSASWRTLTAKKLLDLLRNQKLNDEELPEIMHRKDMTEREAKIYGHLRTLFKLVYSDEYRDILAILTLLPPDGFDAAEFLLTTDKKKHLKRLENGGWVRRQEEDNLLLIHPLIRTILKKELIPTNIDCEKFLDKLWSRHVDEYPPKEDLLIQLAEIYFRASKDLGDPIGSYNFRAGHCYLLLKNFYYAYGFAKRSVEIRQVIFPKFDSRIAEAYLEAGVGKLFMEWFANLRTAAICILNAVIIYERTATDSEQLAEAYASLALVFEKLKNFSEAIRLSEKALTIFNRKPPKNEFKVALVHRNFGRFLMKAGQYNESRDHLQTAMTILEKLTPQGHLNVVSAYRELAELYKVSGNIDSAIHYAEKMLKMLEGIHSKNLGDIGRAYSFIAELYSIMSRNKNTSRIDSSSYLKKSNDTFQIAQQMYNTSMLSDNLRILKRVEEGNDVDQVIRRYRGVADCCRGLKRYSEAEKYILSAVKKIVSDKIDPMEIYLTYFSASQIYTNMKKFDLALDYAHRSLEVYRRTFPNDEQTFLKTQFLNIYIIENWQNQENKTT